MSRLAQVLSDVGNPAADTAEGDRWIEGIATGLFTLQSLGLMAFPAGNLTEEQIRDKLDYAAALGTLKYFESKKD